MLPQEKWVKINKATYNRDNKTSKQGLSNNWSKHFEILKDLEENKIIYRREM